MKFVSLLIYLAQYLKKIEIVILNMLYPAFSEIKIVLKLIFSKYKCNSLNNVILKCVLCSQRVVNLYNHFVIYPSQSRGCFSNKN